MYKNLNANTWFTKWRGITRDFVINIIASMVYTFARQLVLFPFLAWKLTASEYGLILTVTGLVNVYGAALGNSLNNIRLIRHHDYGKINASGDFSLILLVITGLSMVLSLVAGIIFHLASITILLLIFYTAVFVLREYYSVYFRISLQYKRILISNIILALFYCIGALLFANTALWPAAFLLAEAIGLVYTIKFSSSKERFKRTPLFTETTKKYLLLVFSGLLASFLMYADRLLIFPVLGSENVSFFSVASFVGKSAGMVMTPIAGVMLSYFAQEEFRINQKYFWGINGAVLIIMSIFALFCNWIAPWILKIFYPTLVTFAMPYLQLANLGAILGIMGNMIHPMILRFCHTKWLVFIQIVYGVVYLGATMLLMPYSGLYGFCWGVILANTVRICMMCFVGGLFIKKAQVPIKGPSPAC